MDKKTIPELCNEKGLKQKWVAKQLGISYAMLWNYSNGKHWMPAEILAGLADILKVEPSKIYIPWQPTLKQRQKGGYNHE